MHKDGKNLFSPPATDIQIKELESKLECTLPHDFKSFLLTTSGFDGFIGNFYSVFDAVDKRTNPYSYGLLPFIAVDNDFIPLSNDFEKFIQRLFDDTVLNK
jgi:hypothetical protein